MTSIVNKSVTKHGGVLSIDVRNPYFTEVREKIELKYGGEKNKGHIRCVAEKICGGPEKLDEAIEQGQVTVSTDENGVAFYAIKTMVCGKTTTIKNLTRIGKAQAISSDDFAKVANQLAAIGWNFKASQKQAKDAEEGKGYPTVCIEKMDSAKDASKKLLASCSQLVKQAISTLVDKMSMLQNKEATLDSMRLLGRWPNKRVATIDEVIKRKKYLGCEIWRASVSVNLMSDITNEMEKEREGDRER